jgi:sensor histidine kinase YesM
MNKKHITIFIFIIAFIAVSFQYVSDILSKEQDYNATEFIINFPICLLIAFVDLLIINQANKRFSYRKNIYIRFIFELFVTSLFTISILSLKYFAYSLHYANDPDYLGSISIGFVGNCIVVLMIELFFYNKRELEAEKQMAIIEKEKIEYLYENLKNQVNPHFLFNSLNVLSSLTYENPKKANLFTKKLSNIYRYVLSSKTRKTVLLSEELVFLQSYFFLEKIRFNDALSLEIVDETTGMRNVIPVSLQLLVENATKHNMATTTSPLIIKIHLTDEKIRVSNNLQLRNNRAKNGFGLMNLQKQYHIYGKQITIQKTNHEFVVELPYIDNENILSEES